MKVLDITSARTEFDNIIGNVKSMKDFAEIIRDKNILAIPIVSSINRDTNEWNLDADGNINRIITTFEECNTYKELNIVLPKNVSSMKFYVNFLNKNKNKYTIHTHLSNNFGIHAGEQRTKREVYVNLINDLFNKIDIICNIDYIICESQSVCEFFLGLCPEKVIYLNPILCVPGYERVYNKEFEEFDQFLIDKCKYFFTTTPIQALYYQKYIDKMIYMDHYMNRDLSEFVYDKDISLSVFVDYLKKQNKTIYYIPYRMTDEAYKMDEVLDFIIKTEGDYIILYTDPNNSHYLDNHPNTQKIPSNRNSYYTMLDSDVIIPYFEDLDYSNHASIDEMLSEQSKCTVLIKEQKYRRFNNVRFKTV